MSNNKPYTSSLPDVRAKQKSVAKAAIKEQLPLIIECLLEDDEALGKLAEALQSYQPTKKIETKK